MKKIRITILLLFLVSFLALPILAGAALCGDGECTGNEDFDNCPRDCPLIESRSEVLNVVSRVAEWLYVLALTIGVIMLILGGISFMTAGGDEDKLAAARGKVVYGIVGIAIALLAWGVKSLLISFLQT